MVVGAGASHELGLPTGEKLKESLSQLLNITFPDGYQQATGDHGIVQVLRPKVAGTWLVPFFQMLTENVRKEELLNLFDNLVIINFNYDRCLELFLPSALKTYYGVDDNIVTECMERAKIVHPYGVVGNLEGSGPFKAGFGSNRYDLPSIAAGIRTFAEGLADEELGRQIEQTCAEAERIVFLGFAYHPINMQLLATEKSSSARKIFGTTFGFSDAATRVVRSTLLQTFKKR